MPRPWSEQRKKRLNSMRAAGRSADAIAQALGLRREQVIARLELMDMWERNRASFALAMKKRTQVRDIQAREAIADMKKALARGANRGTAMLAANKAGATWREIGEHFGISAQAASGSAHSRLGGRRARATTKKKSRRKRPARR
jgi:predicted PhzF superfamily epimerase YddE/YHI9